MLHDTTGFLIDMDGAVYRGSKIIDGAPQFIERLQQLAVPFMFLTNNSQRSRRDVCLRLERMGIRVLEETVFTTLNMEMLERAVTLINNGARLIATNLDPNCPTESGSRPGCGAIVSMLEAATGRKALGIGKPSPLTFQEAARELGTEPAHTVMVGDTMDTDILGGIQLGFTTVLVLSGGTTRADLGRYAYQPNYVVKSVQDLIDHELMLGVLPDTQPARLTA